MKNLISKYLNHLMYLAKMKSLGIKMNFLITPTTQTMCQGIKELFLLLGYKYSITIMSILKIMEIVAMIL